MESEWSFVCVACWLAGRIVMKGGGRLVGTWCSARRKRRGGWIFRPGRLPRGALPTVFVAFVGAVIVIVAQRRSGARLGT